MNSRNVTSRRKVALKPPNTGESDDEDYVDPKSSRNNTRHHPYASKGSKIPTIIPAVKKQESVVASLLNAHLSMKRAINSANCFTTNTILDAISKDFVETEAIQDMAVAVNEASHVYGYRVDRTHTEALDARLAIVKGKSGKEGEAEETPETTGRKRVVHANEWQDRYQEMMYGEGVPTNTQESEENQAEEANESTVQHEEKDNCIVNERDDIQAQLDKLLTSRKEQALSIFSRSKMVEEDDERFRIVSVQLSENDYYHKAISRYNEGTAASLLLRNARVSGDGRVMYLHGRIIPDTVEDPKEVGSGFLTGCIDIIHNALAEKEKRVNIDLMPSKELSDTIGIVQDDDEMEDLLAPVTPEEVDVKEEAQDPVEATNENAIDQDDATLVQPPDESVYPEVTLVHQPIEAPNAPLPVAQTSTLPIRRRGNAVHRGVNLQQLYIDDTIDLGVKPYEIDVNELKRLGKAALEVDEEDRVRGLRSDELSFSNENLIEAMEGFKNRVLDEDLAELDFLWTSKPVHLRVHEQDCEDMIDIVNEVARTYEQSRDMKKRILRPGDYIFFTNDDTYVNPHVSSDPWPEVQNRAQDNDNESVIFDQDFGCPEAMDANLGSNDYDSFNASDHDDDMEMEDVPTPVVEVLPRAKAMETHREDVPDVATDAAANPEDAIGVGVVKRLGKLDDAHWKGEQLKKPKKKIRPKKKEAAKKDGKLTNSIRDFLASGHTPAADTTDEKAIEDILEPLYECVLSRIEACPSIVAEDDIAMLNKRRHNKPKKFQSKTFLPELEMDIGGEPNYETYYNKAARSVYFDAAQEFGLKFRNCDSLMSNVRRVHQQMDYDHPWKFLQWGLKHFQSYQMNNEIKEPEGKAYKPEKLINDLIRYDADYKFAQMDKDLFDEDDEEAIDEEIPQPSHGNPLSAIDPVETSENASAASPSALDNDDWDGGFPDDDIPEMPDNCTDQAETVTTEISIDVKPNVQPAVKKEKSKHGDIIQELQEVQNEDAPQERGELVKMLNKKIAIKNCNVDQSKVKNYFKEILTNHMMDSKALKTVARSADVENTLRTSGGSDATLLNAEDRTIVLDDTLDDDSFDDNLNDEIDPLDISRMILAPANEMADDEEDEVVTDSGELINSVVVSNFSVQGEHSMSSIMACLPFRANRPHEKQMHVSFAFSVALQMCNENLLFLDQKRAADGTASGSWMNDFVVRNADSNTKIPGIVEGHEPQP